MAPVVVAAAPLAGEAHGWWMDGILTAWAVICRWISFALQAFSRCTWWLTIAVIGLGAFAGAGRGDIGPEEILDDSFIPTIATTRVVVFLLAGAVDVHALHPEPMPG